MKQSEQLRLLNAVAVTGAGTGEHLGAIMKTHVLNSHFTNTGGSVTALVITLEGSIDGNHWFTLGTETYSAGELTAKQASTVVSSQPTLLVRANITTLTDTGTSAVSVYYGGCII